MKTKAIITDLDGTLLPKGGCISPENRTALQQVHAWGCRTIIATGRNLYAACQVLPEDLPLDYLVFSSGAGILHWPSRQLLSARGLNRTETQELADYLWEYRINFTIQKEIPDNHYFYYTNIYPLHEDYKRRLATYLSFGIPISSPADIQSGATQFILILDALQLRLLEKIRADLPDYSVVRSTSPMDNRAIWLEIFPQGVHKGSACLALLEQLELSPDVCAGLGNDYNDVDFLEICGEAYMVGNAPERLKSRYKLVASDRENGFSEFISRLL